MDEEPEQENGSTPDEQSPAGGVEVVVVSDEAGRGIHVTCAADAAPADLVEGLCDLLAQVTRAVVARPRATRAADLGLGNDIF
ncbi:MAG: hypothetical protein H0T92_16575 [Pyrinomonadaceae bacterium]|nr:hypothetical protein [Pyrinomonadaceae bacterium]